MVRYIKQFEFKNPYNVLNGPVELEKGAVLLDATSGKYYLQLKFVNVGTTGLSQAKVCIESLNNLKRPAYPEIYAVYDNHVEWNGTFGTKKLLHIPNNDSVAFYVYAVQIVTTLGFTQNFTRAQYFETYTEPAFRAVGNNDWQNSKLIMNATSERHGFVRHASNISIKNESDAEATQYVEGFCNDCGSLNKRISLYCTFCGCSLARRS